MEHLVERIKGSIDQVHDCSQHHCTINCGSDDYFWVVLVNGDQTLLLNKCFLKSKYQVLTNIIKQILKNNGSSWKVTTQSICFATDGDFPCVCSSQKALVGSDIVTHESVKELCVYKEYYSIEDVVEFVCVMGTHKKLNDASM